MYESYRARRRFQYNGFVYAPQGPCECSTDPGSDLVTDRVDSNGRIETGKFDKNPCYNDLSICKAFTATGCDCVDNGYCGALGGLGACGIRPYQYGGDIWLVDEFDPRKEYILVRRFAMYDPGLPPAQELMKEDRYRVLVQGEPTPDKVWFPPQGEVIQGIASSVSIDEAAPETETIVDKALAAM